MYSMFTYLYSEQTISYICFLDLPYYDEIHLWLRCHRLRVRHWVRRRWQRLL